MEKDDFNFVEDIDWERLAEEAGGILHPTQSVGYGTTRDDNYYASRMEDGRYIVWEDGEVTVLTAEEWEEDDWKYHITFP